MFIAMLLTTISPYTAFLPLIYISYKVLQGKITIDNNPWNIGLILLFFCSLISGILNESLLSIFVSLALLIYFCFSVFLQNNFHSEDKIEKVLKYSVLFSIFSALLGIVEKIIFTYFDCTPWKVLLGIESLGTINHRIYSTFGNPNVAGNWFAIMILVCIYLSTRTSKANKLFYKISMLLFLIALFLTGSDGAGIGLIFGLFTYYIFNKNKKKLFFHILLFTFIAILLFIFPQTFVTSNLNKHELSVSSISRFAIWEGCFKMMKLKPLTGWGLIGIYEHGINFINYHKSVTHGHNIWITLMTTLGVFGTSIYLYMKIYLYKSIKKLYNNNSKITALFASIQVLVIGHGLFDFTIMTPQTGILFITCSALISSLAIQYKNSTVATSISTPSCNTLTSAWLIKNSSINS